MNRRFVNILCIVAVAIIAFTIMVNVAEAKKKTADPKHCEVCKKVVGDLIAKVKEMPKKQQKDKNKIEKIIAKYCKDKGKKLNPKEKKVCYYLEPIKREVSTPISFGAPVDCVCKKLEKKNDEICQVKYKIKLKKGEMNYAKMRVKHLRQILADRGVACTGCTEKSEFVKKCQNTEHLEM